MKRELAIKMMKNVHVDDNKRITTFNIIDDTMHEQSIIVSYDDVEKMLKTFVRANRYVNDIRIARELSKMIENDKNVDVKTSYAQLKTKYFA